ncbi:MAG: hypothetical protein JWP88_1678 [Flaviaesturariibacter sp.]|nr:hypothetical protein [Flaviaesturariibacter sp.]
MNIINKAFLKLALLPAPLYKSMGIHLPQLRSILHTKLTMDDRRASPLAQARRNKKSKPVSMATLGTMLLSALMGVFFLFAFAIGKDPQTQLTFYFSMFFFMLSATLISDFTSVLIDIRDTFIILPKPVNDRTFVLARLLHIFIHICKLVLPMSLPGIIYMGIHSGIGSAILLLFLVLLVTLFAIFFINAIYILILRFTTPEKFKNIISYFQIVFAVIMYASYQVFPRLIGKFNMENFSFTTRPGIAYYPFYWFASAWNLLHTGKGSTQTIFISLLALFVPIACLYIVVRYLAPSFNNRLAMINGSSSETAKPTAKKIGTTTTNTYSQKLSRVFTRTAAERMGFLFTWKLMGRSRDFKMKVYPSIGYLLVYGFIMFYGKSFSLNDFSDETSKGKILILSLIYFGTLLLNMSLTQMVFSDRYKASWFYYTTPLQRPGDVILGATKAAVLKFYIPLVVLITIPALVIIGPRVLPNIILGLFNQLLIAFLTVYIGHKYFPFSTPQNNNMKGGSFLRGIMLAFAMAIVGIGHFFLYAYLPVVILGAALSVLATWLMVGSIRNTSWAAIKSSYTED